MNHLYQIAPFDEKLAGSGLIREPIDFSPSVWLTVEETTLRSTSDTTISRITTLVDRPIKVVSLIVTRTMS